MNKNLVTFLIGLLLLTGCATPALEPTATTEPTATLELSPTIAASPTPLNLATSAEDIVGEWRSHLGFFTEFYQDGTYAGGTFGPGQIGPDAPIIGNYWFEGTTFFIEDIRNDYYQDELGIQCLDIGSYEIILMENGDLIFLLIEDVCDKRSENYIGVNTPVD